jgi:hypothetical protein
LRHFPARKLKRLTTTVDERFQREFSHETTMTWRADVKGGAFMCAGILSPSDWINLAHCVSTQGFRVMLSFLSEPEVQSVAACDIAQNADDFV